MTRYEGKPFLRILECYVLHAINELGTQDAQRLESMEPKLREIYGIQGNWREIVSQVMHFPEMIDDQFQKMWDRNCQLAAENDETLKPEDFARMVIDDNFNR